MDYDAMSSSDWSRIKLHQYDWPGNIRELMYSIERLVVIAKENVITEHEIGKYFDEMEFDLGENDITDNSPPLSEEDMIISALAQCNSNITRTAKLLGIDRSTLYRKLRTYKIQVKKSY